MKDLLNNNIAIFPTNNCLSNLDDLKKQHALLIHAYAHTEKEIWGENYVRICWDEYRELIEKEQVFTAKLNEEVVGTILLCNHGDRVFSFGLLAVDFSKKGLGIGRKLIEKVEEWAAFLGGEKMTLEILRPTNEIPSFKQHLAQWYERLGYTFCDTLPFLQLKPDKAAKAELLITPAVFDCYEKRLN